MPENVMAAPDRTERAKARRMKHVERGQIGANCLATFHVHHAGEDSLIHRGTDFRHRAADPPCFGTIELQRDREFFHGDIERRLSRKGSRQRRHIVALPVRLLQNQIP